jgi:hypothetical protein
VYALQSELQPYRTPEDSRALAKARPPMTYALIGLSVLLASMLVPTGAWLHAEISEGKRIRDRLDEEKKLSAEYQHERDVTVAKLKVTEDLLTQEKNLRVIAESQRNAAQQKARAYLARNLVTASENEITDVVQELFSTPLALVPGNELERP